MQKELLVIKNTKSGFSLVEIILSIALFALLLTAIAGFYIYGQQSSIKYGEKSRAYAIAEQALEAIKNIKDTGFNNIAIGTYGLVIGQNGSWELLSEAPDIIEGFTRIITIEELDDNTKKVTITITQTINSITKTIATLTSKFTNWMAELVSLVGWGNPAEESWINLSGFGGYTNAKTYINGDYAYIINNGADENFAIINISDTKNPVYVNGFSLPDNPSDITINAGYAIVSSGTKIYPIDILSDPEKPGLHQGFDVGGTNIKNIFLDGNTGTGYVITYEKLYAINLTNPTEPNILWSENIQGGYDIYVSGDYAYFTSTDKRNLQIMRLQDHKVLSDILLSDDSGQNPSITVSGNIALVSQLNTLFTVDISNPISPVILENITLEEQITDIALNSTNNSLCFVTTRGIEENDSTKQFYVIDINNLGAPFGTLSVGENENTLYGPYYDAKRDRVFAIHTAEKFGVLTPSLGGWNNPSKEFSIDISEYKITYDRSRTYVYGNYAYTIHNDTHENLIVFDTTNLEPPITLKLEGRPSDISIYNGFAYITSDAQGKELQIINTSNLNSDVIGSYGHDSPMRSIFIQNDLAYILSYSKLLILDISDRVNPKLLGDYTIFGGDIYVSGNYAYISNMQDDGKGLLILDISDPKSIINTGYASVGGGTTFSTSIIVSGDTAIMSYDNMLYTIDISSKENPVLFDPGYIDLGDTIYDVALNLYDSKYIFIGTEGKYGFGFSVINIENPSTPTILSQIATSPGGEPLLGLYYDKARNKVFGLGKSREFMAIQPAK